MADDFDVEAMLEAPYRKVGAEVKEIKLMFYTWPVPYTVIATMTKFTWMLCGVFK